MSNQTPPVDAGHTAEDTAPGAPKADSTADSPADSPVSSTADSATDAEANSQAVSPTPADNAAAASQEVPHISTDSAVSVEALLDLDEAKAREEAAAAQSDSPAESTSDDAQTAAAAADDDADKAQEAADENASEVSAGTAEGDEFTDDRTFDDLDLEPKVRKALDDMGYHFPMPVQLAVYDQLISGKDVMVQSRTGSGKTAGFGIPIVQRISASTSGAQALILAPTRELALQVAREVEKLSIHKGLSVAPVYGGAPMKKQIDQLRAGAQIIAGTPGRVLDHLRRKTLNGDGIGILVLDECDEMLSMGFLEEIDNIISFLPVREERQTVLFSATIPPEIQRIARRHMVEPESISLSDDGIGVDEIEHFYYVVSGMARTRDLLKVIKTEEPESAIIFCNTREDTNVVARFLREHGYDADALSGDLTQNERERVMAKTRAQNLRFLVATDVAARGIDISDLSHVINYTFPESPEVYVHRTGRTGRAGKSGVAVSLVGPRELSSFYYLKLIYKIRPTERDLPSSDAMSAILEGERYRDLVERVDQEPTDEYRALARRVWQSHQGERIVAYLLQRLLTRSVARSSGTRSDRAQQATPNEERPERAETSERSRHRDRDDSRRSRDRGDRDDSRRSRDRGDRDDSRRSRDRGDRDRDRDRDDSRRSRDRDRDRDERRRTRDRDGEDSPRTRDRDGEDSPRTRDRDGEDSPRGRDRDRDDSRRPRERSRERAENRRLERREERKERREERKERREERRERRSRRDDEPRGNGSAADAPRRSTARSPVEDSTPMRAYDSADPNTGYNSGNPEDREFWEVWADERETRSHSNSARSRESDNNGEERRPNGQEHSVRLFVNLGKREDITEDQVRELLGADLGDDAQRITSIALRTNHCYVRVPEELVDRVIDQATGKSFNDRAVVVERARR